MPDLHVNLVTPEHDVLHTDVDQVTAPSVLGEVGILKYHLPLLAQLGAGPVGLFTGANKVEYYAVSGGFLEVDQDTVTILADTAERWDHIDVKRSKKALESARKELEKLDYTDPRYAEQEARARRAEVRLHVAELGR